MRDVTPIFSRRRGELGGVWNYDLPAGRVYKSTHMISSKPFTQYPDFPMPAAFSDFPHPSQVLQYLRGYADEFDLHPHISFDSTVEHVQTDDENGSWKQ